MGVTISYRLGVMMWLEVQASAATSELRNHQDSWQAFPTCTRSLNSCGSADNTLTHSPTTPRNCTCTRTHAVQRYTRTRPVPHVQDGVLDRGLLKAAPRRLRPVALPSGLWVPRRDLVVSHMSTLAEHQVSHLHPFLTKPTSLTEAT